MDLVDYINFISCSRRSEINFLKDRSDVIDTVIGSGIHLCYVKNGTVQDALTCGAFITGIAVNGVFAVDRACKDLGYSGLTCTVLTAEKISVSKLPGND